MSWHCSRALVAEFSGATCLDGTQSAPSNTTPTPEAFYWPDKTTEHSRLSRFGMTSEPLTVDHGAELLTWFREVSLARTSAQPAVAMDSMESEADSGRKWLGLLARYDQDARTWRTPQCSLVEGLDEYSETWPRWGSMRNGESFLRPTPALHICESASGLWQTPVADDSVERAAGKWNSRGEPKLSAEVKLWPTPTATLGSKGGRVTPRKSREGGTLIEAVSARTWPTPCATASKGSSPAALTRKDGKDRSNDRIDHAVMASDGGQLNPEWVELLMGWPKGFTSLEPLPKEEFDAWHKGFGEQDLPYLQSGVQPSQDQRPAGGCDGFHEAQALQPFLCEHADGSEAGNLSLACPEAQENALRVMRLFEEASGSPLRPGSEEQRSVESSNAVQSLSRLLARYGQKAWQSGSWEDAVPRTINGLVNRGHRIKGLGNGQVPACAAAAFTLLSND